MKPIVEVNDLWYAYPDPLSSVLPWTLQGVNLQLTAGELVCLLGPSGAGKSTLAQALVGIVPQSTGGRVRGQVLVDGLDARQTPVPLLASRVGLVFQDPETQFLQTTVQAEVAFGLENLGLPREQIRIRLQQALAQVDLLSFEARSPQQLSGGEKQRVAIAAVLAMWPSVLVLDEPTASLDPLGKRQVFQAVRKLRREQTVLVITQDAEWAADHADRVLVLDGGRIVMQGTPQEVLGDVAGLARHGLRGPQVSELADCLNRRLGTNTYGFVRLEQATRELAGEPAR